MTTLHTTLISPEALRELMEAGPSPILVDTSFDLADVCAGERSWRGGHLPSARYLHLDRDLSGTKTGRNGRHPLPDRAAFARTLGRLGITPQTQVVTLDRQGGVYAARLWWMLRWMGHEAVAVLDGGVAAWQQVGGALETSDTTASEAPPYPGRPSLAPVIEADALAACLGQLRLVDARAGERFRGEVELLDAAAGHIPGALNRFFKDNLDDHGRFKPAAHLHEAFSALAAGRSPAEVVHHCGSGVTACHNLLAMEHVGLAGSVLYPGSWSEWSASPERPIARG